MVVHLLPSLWYPLPWTELPWLGSVKQMPWQKHRLWHCAKRLVCRHPPRPPLQRRQGEGQEHPGRRVRVVGGGGTRRVGAGVAVSAPATVAPARAVNAAWMSWRRGGRSGTGEGGEGGSGSGIKWSNPSSTLLTTTTGLFPHRAGFIYLFIE